MDKQHIIKIETETTGLSTGQKNGIWVLFLAQVGDRPFWTVYEGVGLLWWSIFIIKLTGFRITFETSFGACLWEPFHRALNEKGKLTLTVSAIPWAGISVWMRRTKKLEHPCLSLSLLPVRIGCDQMSHTPADIHSPLLWAVPLDYGSKWYFFLDCFAKVFYHKMKL